MLAPPHHGPHHSDEANSASSGKKAEKATARTAVPPLAPPDLPHLRHLISSLWPGLRHWFTANTFAPAGLPRSLHAPVIGYLVAAVSQVLIAMLDLLVFPGYPSLPHYLPFVLVVLVVAFSWGGGPSLVAALTGALLLEFLVVPLTFSWTFAHELDIAGLALYLGSSLIVSAFASQKERARRTAEHLLRVAEEARQDAEGLAASLREEQAHSELERSRLRTILELLPVGVVLANANGQIVEINPEGRGIWGADAPQVGIAQYDEYKAWRPDTGQRITAEDWAMARALSSGEESLDEELLIEAFDGCCKTVLNSAVPIRDETGRIVGTVATVLDISERKQLEDALRQAERKAADHASQLEALFEAMVDGVMVYNREGHILRMNTAAMGLFGPVDGALSAEERFRLYQPRNEQGQPFSLDQWPLSRVLRGEVLAGANAVDQRFINFQGQEVEISISGAPIVDASGQMVGAMGMFRDVSARRQLERRTHQALNTLLAMAEALVQTPYEQVGLEEIGGAASVAAQRLVELVSHVLGCPRVSIATLDLEQSTSSPLAVLGLPPEQESDWWAGERYSAHWINGKHPELISRLQVGETLVLDTSQPPLQGEPNPYQASTFLAVPMRIGERLLGLLIVVPASQTYHYTNEELALAEAAAKLGALVIERERLLREREEAHTNELALRQANRKMDAFLGMASHELKTPLTTIKLSLQLTERRMENLLRNNEAMTDGEMHKKARWVLEQLARTGGQADRLDRLVNDLLDVSRIQEGKLELRLEVADLAAIVRQATEEQHQIAPSRTITFCAPTHQHVPACVDADRIGQVVTNYLTNALKYSPEERPVEVGVTVVGTLARVWVHDAGPGIPVQEHERVWERFHRVPGIEVCSGSGIGLGLGLHISRTIIERHQGQVGVQSVPGAGSTFWFTLPLAQEEPVPEGEAQFLAEQE